MGREGEDGEEGVFNKCLVALAVNYEGRCQDSFCGSCHVTFHGRCNN